MRAKLYIYHDSKRSDAVVLNAEFSESDLLQDYGSNMERWPEDLGIYDRGSGMFVWEGKIREDDTFEGELRPFNDADWTYFRRFCS